MDRKKALRKILSAVYISFCLWFLGPIVIELLSEPPEGDEIGLSVLLSLLIAGSFLSIGLWYNTVRLNKSLAFKWLILIAILLLGIVVFLFTYSSWILLVASLSIFYVWTKRIIKRKMDNLTNLTWVSIFSLVISIYIFFQLIP